MKGSRLNVWVRAARGAAACAPFAMITSLMVTAGCGGSSESRLPASNERQGGAVSERTGRGGTVGAAPVPQSTQPAPSEQPAAAELVDPTRLEGFLPEVSGWRRQTPETGRMTSPIPMTQTSAVYTRAASAVTVKIIDAGGNPRLFSPFAGLMATDPRTETQGRSGRAVSVDGYPAWEKWDAGTRNGEMGVSVDRRFLVQLEGRGVESIDPLREILNSVAIDRLAAVR